MRLRDPGFGVVGFRTLGGQGVGLHGLSWLRMLGLGAFLVWGFRPRYTKALCGFGFQG